LAASTLIILFSKMLKISKTDFFLKETKKNCERTCKKNPNPITPPTHHFVPTYELTHPTL